MIFLGRIFIILLLKKSPKQHGQGKFLKKIQKKLSHFKEKNYEIVKLFGKFGQIYSFLLLKLPYLANRFANM
jgi:hypothetical protein